MFTHHRGMLLKLKVRDAVFFLFYSPTVLVLDAFSSFLNSFVLFMI